MNEPEKFLERWSRRKIEAENDESREQIKPDSTAEDSPPVSVPESAKETKSDFDPKTLPPLDSIGAATDIRAYLAPGVPEDLRHAALQRVWRTDPAIRDFVELAENSWDFNDPNGAHGFGPLEVTEKIKQAVEAMFGSPVQRVEEKNLDDVTGPAQQLGASRQQASIATNDQISATEAPSEPEPDHVAPPQNARKMNDRNPQRGHGSALPK
jgi:hypothetical protein